MLQLVQSRRSLSRRKPERRSKKKRPPNAIGVAVREFAREMGVDFDALPDGDRGAVFERFAAFHILRRFHEQELEPARMRDLLSSQEASADCVALMINGGIVCDAQEIDAILETCGETLSFSYAIIKASRSPRFEPERRAAFVEAVCGFLSDAPSGRAPGGLRRAAELAQRLTDGAKAAGVTLSGSAYCYYAGLGAWELSEASTAALIETRRTMNAAATWLDDVEFEIVDKHRILDFMVSGSPLRQIPESVSGGLQFEDYEAFLPAETLLALPRIRGVETGYQGHVAVDEFLGLLERDDGQGMREGIFTQNVRGYQGDGGVNERIRDTLLGRERAQFLLRNNGVTVVADSVSREGQWVRLSNFQIVNGLQTSNVIYRIRDHLRGARDVFVPVKIIATEETRLRRAIIDATNRQTPITGAALFAACEKALAIEEYFLERFRAGGPPLVLERRPGQYAKEVQAQRVTLEELLRAFYGVFLGQSQKAEKGFAAIVGEVDDGLLAPSLTPEAYYTAARLLTFVREVARERDEPRLAQIEYHAALGLRLMCCPSEPPLGDAKAMKALCRKIELQLNAEGRREALGALLLQITQSPRDRMRSRVQGVPQLKRTRDDIMRRALAEVLPEPAA